MNLTHSFETESKPERVIVLGGAGVTGKGLASSLEAANIPFISLTRQDLDLAEKSSVKKLTSLLQPTDVLVFLATITPGKGRGLDAFVKNIQMAENVCEALTQVKPAHVIYLSSDTVYALNRGIISEESPADPENLFGVMHLSREYMLKTLGVPLAILRSTLIYSVDDTHNSYGPNRMRRLAQKEGKITLFGKGEECRDHISIEDVSELIKRVMLHRSKGILNLATGHSISYYDLAHKIKALYGPSIEVVETPRQNPITHRHFDVTAVYKAFPTFSFTPLDKGLEKIQSEELCKV